MLDYRNANLIVDSSAVKSGNVAWRSPSNIAIVKYWGKHGVQLPRNPSISFTLQQAHTTTYLNYAPKDANHHDVTLEFRFANQPNPAFQTKIQRYLESLTDIFPFLKQLHLTIESNNSFPHSAGIASSASAMSALALCLCEMEQQLFGTLQKESEFLQKASYLARLGSGSACRSVYPEMAVWGENSMVEGSSDLYAVPFANELHPVFQTFQDTILLVSKKEKSVSSRAGHGLMEGNIFAESRYQQARQNFLKLTDALKTGDVDTFGEIAELEALTLHALMMSSTPPFILLQPNTFVLIEKVRNYRAEARQPLYFTLDAGPNLHLLYPQNIKLEVSQFIASELLQYCEDKQKIDDYVGAGGTKL
jgi:diphosphomevalonate decarboxylase